MRTSTARDFNAATVSDGSIDGAIFGILLANDYGIKLGRKVPTPAYLVNLAKSAVDDSFSIGDAITIETEDNSFTAYVFEEIERVYIVNAKDSEDNYTYVINYL